MYEGGHVRHLCLRECATELRVAGAHAVSGNADGELHENDRFVFVAQFGEISAVVCFVF
jgi:hypothetical protein